MFWHHRCEEINELPRLISLISRHLILSHLILSHLILHGLTLSFLSLFLSLCFAVLNAERDPLLFYRELPDDHSLPDRSCGHDHAEDAQERHQHLQ